MATFGTPVKDEAFGASRDTTVDCGSGSDRFLAVGVAKTTGGAVDTITYNSVFHDGCVDTDPCPPA